MHRKTGPARGNSKSTELRQDRRARALHPGREESEEEPAVTTSMRFGVQTVQQNITWPEFRAFFVAEKPVTFGDWIERQST